MHRDEEIEISLAGLDQELACIVGHTDIHAVKHNCCVGNR